MLDITFITIAQNEERNIVGCIDSCKGIGQHLIVDGGSTDSTPELARCNGASVISQPFEYAAKQYNLALDNVTTEWAFIIDADERLSNELYQQLIDLEDPPRKIAGYDVPRLNYFLGSPVRHSGWWPDYNVRLMRAQSCRYDDRPVHARVKAEGTISKVSGCLFHNTYLSIEQYISKANKFTTREVRARSRDQQVLDRRSRLRSIWLRIPARPVTRFLYMYFVRGGFRGGRLGFDLAVLGGIYEVMVGLKTRYPDDEVPTFPIVDGLHSSENQK